MLRIFRDNRLPRMEVRNDGSQEVSLWVKGNVGDYFFVKDGYTRLDCFDILPYPTAEEVENVATDLFDNIVNYGVIESLSAPF